LIKKSFSFFPKPYLFVSDLCGGNQKDNSFDLSQLIYNLRIQIPYG